MPSYRGVFTGDSWLIDDYQAASLYNFLVAMANVRPSQAKRANRVVEVPRGSVLTSYRELAAKTGLSVKRIRTMLRNLSGIDPALIGLKSGTGQGTGYTLITIVDYEELYGPKDERAQAEAQQGHSKGTGGAQLGHGMEQENKVTREQENKNAENLDGGSAAPPPAVDEVPYLDVPIPEAEYIPPPEAQNETLVLKAQEAPREAKTTRTKARAPQKAPSDGSRVFEAYRAGFVKAYGEEPIRNAMVNALCAQLVGRLGPEAAAQVAEWFPTHRASRYTAGGHSLKLLIMDAEKLAVEFKAGRQMTENRARQMDRDSTNSQVFAAALSKMGGST